MQGKRVIELPSPRKHLIKVISLNENYTYYAAKNPAVNTFRYTVFGWTVFSPIVTASYTNHFWHGGKTSVRLDVSSSK
jgi:hypothetical protein